MRICTVLSHPIELELDKGHLVNRRNVTATFSPNRTTTMLREERVAETEYARMEQEHEGSSDERRGSCAIGVLCVIGLILALALLAPSHADVPMPHLAVELVK
ncbi:hypothetical protein [Phyllobacterium sp. YR620]|uniref:hypothetical protein n=1 Tax=Phyllobacterium sp. YR620 TaxID=1881066 RepID=UPI00111336EC|nr:hypothetical protein [Phyllobacterium sp. YR620]